MQQKHKEPAVKNNLSKEDIVTYKVVSCKTKMVEITAKGKGGSLVKNTKVPKMRYIISIDGIALMPTAVTI